MSDASSSAASASSCVAISVPLSSSSGPSSTSTRWWNSSRRASAPNWGILPSSAMAPACAQPRTRRSRIRPGRRRRGRIGDEVAPSCCARRELLTRVTLWPWPRTLATERSSRARRISARSLGDVRTRHPRGRCESRPACSPRARPGAVGRRIGGRGCDAGRRQRAVRGAIESECPVDVPREHRRPRDLQRPGRARAPHRRERPGEDAPAAGRRASTAAPRIRRRIRSSSRRRAVRAAAVSARSGTSSTTPTGPRRSRHHPHRAARRRAGRADAELSRARHRALHRRRRPARAEPRRPSDGRRSSQALPRPPRRGRDRPRRVHQRRERGRPRRPARGARTTTPGTCTGSRTARAWR